MKKSLTILALVCALLSATLGPAQAQYYGYDSYANQMVRDHINERRMEDRLRSQRKVRKTRRVVRKSSHTNRGRHRAVRTRRGSRLRR